MYVFITGWQFNVVGIVESDDLILRSLDGEYIHVCVCVCVRFAYLSRLLNGLPTQICHRRIITM